MWGLHFAARAISGIVIQLGNQGLCCFDNVLLCVVNRKTLSLNHIICCLWAIYLLLLSNVFVVYEQYMFVVLVVVRVSRVDILMLAHHTACTWILYEPIICE